MLRRALETDFNSTFAPEFYGTWQHVRASCWPLAVVRNRSVAQRGQLTLATVGKWRPDSSMSTSTGLWMTLYASPYVTVIHT